MEHPLIEVDVLELDKILEYKIFHGQVKMMAHVLIAGGGVAGCTAALELADNGIEVTIIEKAGQIGGKVKDYGCKATDQCNNCGVCLAGGLWSRVLQHALIQVLTGCDLIDVIRKNDRFDVYLKNKGCAEKIADIDAIIIAVGFERFSSLSYGQLEIEAGGLVQENPGRSIISAYELEGIIQERTKEAIFSEPPESIAFIQCFGSRDITEKALYCSRVCCGYSTRSARVLREYYPKARIVFFYMELQEVESGNYFNVLNEEGIEFIRCRPVKAKTGKTSGILYEDPETGRIREEIFDIVVLTEGIHPAADAERLAEVCGLGLDANGFLKPVMDGEKTGIYLAGCASGPKSISESCAEALSAARTIIKGRL